MLIPLVVNPDWITAIVVVGQAVMGLIGAVIIKGFWESRRMMESQHAQVTTMLDAVVKTQGTIATAMAAINDTQAKVVVVLSGIESKEKAIMSMIENPDRFGFGTKETNDRLSRMERKSDAAHAEMVTAFRSMTAAINTQSDYLRQVGERQGFTFDPRLPDVQLG